MKNKTNCIHRLMSVFKYIAVVIIIFICIHTQAQNQVIAAGAGYKKPVSEIIASFKSTSGIKTDAIFGNLQMVASQAKQSGEVACIIGDKRFLTKLSSTVNFSNYYRLGKGILVLAYRKGIKLNTPEDLLSDNIQSVFMPQDGKAIYGIAGKEALKTSGLYNQILSKLTEVATVPQVISYLLTGEADAGFINLTEALANKDKLGGYILIDEDNYTKIDIVAAVVEEFKNNKETKEFIRFLQTSIAKDIISKYGL